MYNYVYAYACARGSWGCCTKVGAVENPLSMGQHALPSQESLCFDVGQQEGHPASKNTATQLGIVVAIIPTLYWSKMYFKLCIFIIICRYAALTNRLMHTSTWPTITSKQTSWKKHTMLHRSVPSSSRYCCPF